MNYLQFIAHNTLISFDAKVEITQKLIERCQITYKPINQEAIGKDPETVYD